MNRSEGITELAAALVKAQACIKPPPKSETAGSGKFDYKYADLAGVWDAIRDPLAANGLCVLQFPETDEQGVTVETILLHTSGEWVSNSLSLVCDHVPQAAGSGITYARRYSLMAIVGVAPESEDDGAAANNPSEKRRAAARVKYLPPAPKPENFAQAGYLKAVEAMLPLLDTQAKTVERVEKVKGMGLQAPDEAACLARLREHYKTLPEDVVDAGNSEHDGSGEADGPGLEGLPDEVGAGAGGPE